MSASTVRAHPARRLATLLAAALVSVPLVASCGTGSGASDSGGSPSSPALSPSSTPSSTPGATATSSSAGPVRFEVVQLLSKTAAGGHVSTTAVPVPDVDAARAFASQFSNSDLAAEVAGSVDMALVPKGSSLYAAVVAVGCERPRHVEVGRTADGFSIESTDDPSPGVACYAAVTTVAIVAIAG